MENEIEILIRTYSFNVIDAIKYGVDEAIMLKNIKFWIAENKSKGINFYNDRTWTFNSAKSYAELFPFWTKKQIERILKNLINKGAIVTGNYNKMSYDRTRWYAINLPDSNLEVTEREFRNYQTVTPIPNINTDINTNNNNNNIVENCNKFKKPTVEEIKSYCIERNNYIDAENFYDYYESNGWKVGKNQMKDWKATVRTWERNNYGKPIKKKKNTGLF